mmetsp:Transcript_27688/g.55703  ORF Transcript_27688/g.55703 Transcript_27688/m.55703 type:complete len:171 (+) Transcript_27688:27-539(+)
MKRNFLPWLFCFHLSLASANLIKPGLEILEPAQGSSITLFSGERAPIRLGIELSTQQAHCSAFKLNIRLPGVPVTTVNPCACVDTFEVCILTIMQPDIPRGDNVTIVVDITDPNDEVLARTSTSFRVQHAGGGSSCRCQMASCGCVLRYHDWIHHRTLRCSVAGCDVTAE